jgi:hypothetical protein
MRLSRIHFELLLVLLIGCQSARVQQPLTSTLSADEFETRIEFWQQLSNQSITSNDDAFHAMLLYFEGHDASGNFAERVTRLQALGMLPKGFAATADQSVDRGTLAVALAKALEIKGGATMRLFGASPRYAVRALQYRGLYPESSPNQTFSGAEFVGVMGRVEDFQRGNSANKPAHWLPSETNERRTNELAGAAAPPIFLTMQQAAGGTPPAAKATEQNPADLRIVVTGVEGDAQVRASANAKWESAKVDMRLTGTAEFRTGARSAVRFSIPPDQTYTVDRLSTVKVARAVFNGKKVNTDVGLEKGRVRYDLVRGASKEKSPAPEDEDLVKQIEEAGVEYDSTIRSPNAALAVRGTQVSLYDQPPFAPEAISLTGRAVFRNTRRQLVAFGGQVRASVNGKQTSAAEEALDVATIDRDSPIALDEFDTRQQALVRQRGGFTRNEVLVGDSSIMDAQLLDPLSGLLPGTLNFVLRWDGGVERKLADLNLAVISPLSTSGAPDFVANPPFLVSLVAGEPAAEALRQQRYPRTSRSGGRIGLNHVGPEGLEIASWPSDYPVGNYRVAVFNLVDAVTPPPTVKDPINFRVDTFLAGQKLGPTATGTVGTLQVSPPISVNVPALPGGNR